MTRFCHQRLIAGRIAIARFSFLPSNVHFGEGGCFWAGRPSNRPYSRVRLITNHFLFLFLFNVSSFDFQSCDFSVFLFLQFLWIYDFDVHASHFCIISMVTQGCEWFL